ncbi:MAG: FkbM family methyltransferase [Endomicrobiales bacterium]
MPSVKPDFIELASKLGIERIFECGSRDALDGIELARQLHARELHIFECNPDGIERCQKNLRQASLGCSVYLNPMAVAEKEAVLDFYPINPRATGTDFPDGNIGASSLYRANPSYPYERYVQDRIRVASTSLDAYCRNHPAPDLLWMDLQGAEIRALEGAKAILPRVKMLHVEVMFRPLYLGQPLFWEVHRFLNKQFRLVKLYGIRHRWLIRVKTLLGREKWFTDAVYVNRALPRALEGVARHGAAQQSAGAKRVSPAE